MPSEEDPATDIVTCMTKIGDDRTCSFGDMLAVDIQTDKQTAKRQTRSSQYFASPTGSEVINKPSTCSVGMTIPNV